MRVHTKRWEMSEALWPWRWHDDLCARECRGCSRGRRGQRCYCLTHQHGVKAKSRLMALCVYMCVQLAYELHWYLFNNWSHSHTHTQTLALLRPPLASPAVLRPHLPRRRDDSHAQSEAGERMENGGKERCGFSEWITGEWVSVEKERGDERQGVKQVQREKRERKGRG